MVLESINNVDDGAELLVELDSSFVSLEDEEVLVSMHTHTPTSRTLNPINQRSINYYYFIVIIITQPHSWAQVGRFYVELLCSKLVVTSCGGMVPYGTSKNPCFFTVVP